MVAQRAIRMMGSLLMTACIAYKGTVAGGWGQKLDEFGIDLGMDDFEVLEGCQL